MRRSVVVRRRLIQLFNVKVALEAGVDFSSEALVYLKYRKDCEKDPSLPPVPVLRDPCVKIKPNLKEAEYLKIIMHDSNCRQWQLEHQDAVHKERLAHLFLEKAGIKYQEFRNGLEIDWKKKYDTYPKTVQETYTLLETYKGSEKFISHIVQKVSEGQA